ncbi:MAG: hypothetical protein JW881_01325 [Spirochaetales bacterium]|nr:hypothetical protein [Spirochaetales bacterium]
MATYILNKQKAAVIKLNPQDYNVMIRITNPKDYFITLENEHCFREIMSLRFYDIDDESSGLHLFNKAHLELIIAFFEKHRNCTNMVIHCDEGRSRSAGVAAGWFLFNDNKSSVYRLYHDNIHYPNRRVVELFFEYFGVKKELIDKWERDLFG